MNRSKHRANTLRIALGIAAGVLCLAATGAIAQAPAGAGAAPAAGAPPEGGRRGGGGGEARAPRQPVIPAASLLLPYKPVTPPVTPGEEHGNVAGIGINSKGHVFAYQRTKVNALTEFDANGKVVNTFPQITQTRAHSLRIDSADNIWIADVSEHTVTKLDPTGKVLMTLGTKGKEGTWDEAAGAHVFNQPTDLAFGKNGDIFVSTGHGGPDPRVVHFDKSGKFINTWALAHPDGTRANIHSIAVGTDGNVYAADREVMKIRVFKPDGTFIKDLQVKNLVCSLYVDPKGNFWMTAGQDGMVMAIDWNGNVKGWTGKLGKGPNEYGEAHYMAMTKDLSTIYVSDTVNNRIEKLMK